MALLQSSCEGKGNVVTGLLGNFDGKNIVAVGATCSKGGGDSNSIVGDLDDHHKGQTSGKTFQFQCPRNSYLSRISGKNQVSCRHMTTGETTTHTITDIQDSDTLDLWDSSIASKDASKGLRLLQGRIQLYGESQKDELGDMNSKMFRDGALEDKRSYHRDQRAPLMDNVKTAQIAKTMQLGIPQKPDRSSFLNNQNMLILVAVLTILTMYITSD